MSASEASAWLIETKLHPPLARDDIIRRLRLEERLKDAVSSLPVALLSAPAGYGKTTMLASLPRLLPGYPLAWVTLDAEDNDPVRFVGLLVAAIQRQNAECGQSAWVWLSGEAADSTGAKRAVGALVNDILKHMPGPFILVLDDLHLVTEPAVYMVLEYLFDHQPPGMHIAIGTRSDPPLRLARLAARRRLGEIRRPDLGFSQSEARELLNGSFGLHLTDEEVAAVQERTEGWPAGLCLLAGPLGRMPTATSRTELMTHVDLSERYAMEFLIEEVLRYLPGDTRRFLLETSVLADMTPSTCNAVTGRVDSADILDDLYRRNLTIAAIATAVDGEPVYRHHALFARLLTQQLVRELPGEIAGLHCRAARAQKSPGRAISHYLSAGSWDDAARVMVESGAELLALGMSETIRTWYRALPEKARSTHPRLTVLVGRCEIHRGNYSTAVPLLEQGMASFVAAGDVAGEAATLPSLITLAYQNDRRDAAAKLVDRARELPLNPMGQVSALLAAAWLHLHDGDWKAVSAKVEESAGIVRSTGDRPAALMGATYVCAAPFFAVPGCLESTRRFGVEAAAVTPPDTASRLGAGELGTWPLLLGGRMDEALDLAVSTDQLRQRIAGYPVLGNDTSLLLTVLYAARGDLEATGRFADMLARRVDAAPLTKRAFYLHAAGRALAWSGRIDEAKAMLARLLAWHGDESLDRYLKDLLKGLIALLVSESDAADEALSRAAQVEAELPIAWIGGSARLLKARLLMKRAKPAETVAAVAPVVDGWLEAGMPGRALLDGPVILPALRLAAEHGVASAAVVVNLFAQPFTGAGARDTLALDGLPEPLTQREREVLGLIVAGLTNREIGQKLYVGVETVKSHVVHILRKFGVTSRTQAAIKGRKMGF